MRLLLMTAFILCSSTAWASPDELNKVMIAFLKKSGAVIQCGPATISLTPDKKGLKVDGLPYGLHPLEVKDGEFYLGEHMCKPACSAAAQQRC
jgi:hypothetical protein